MQLFSKTLTVITTAGLVACIAALAIQQPTSWVLPIAIVSLSASLSLRIWDFLNRFNR